MFTYLTYIFNLAAIYLILVLSYAIPVGYTGLFGLGHIGLVAIGAYTSAILTIHGVGFLFSVLLAALLTGLVSFFLALPSKKIKDEYYTLLTLGFLFLVNAVLLNWSKITLGPFGITGIERPLGFTEPESFLILTLVVLVLLAVFVYRLLSSPFGRALEAVRDDELLAASLGKPVAKLKTVSLIISGLGAGLGGAFLANFIQFINPQTFWLDFVLMILAALVIGGLASFSGAVVGTAVIFLISEPLRFLPLPLGLIGPLRLFIFSLLLLLVVLFWPKGLLGKAQLGR